MLVKSMLSRGRVSRKSDIHFLMLIGFFDELDFGKRIEELNFSKREHILEQYPAINSHK